MAKGDEVRVFVRGIENAVLVSADKAGRKLVTEFDKDGSVQWFLVHEKTWTDKTVKTTRFAAAEVLAITSNFTEE